MKPFLSCLLLAVAGSTVAATPPPPPGPPELGPVERIARPIVLVFIPQQPQLEFDPFAQGLIAAAVQGASDARYEEASRRTAQAIRTAVPSLKIEEELRSSLRCGEPGSLCTELVFLDSSSKKFRLDASVIALLNERQWQDARVLSLWWEKEEKKPGRLAAHVASRDVSLDGEKLKSKFPVYASYYVTRPAQAGGVHDEEWEFGAALPRESALRMSLAQLEPMLQMANSRGANNDRGSKQRIEKRPLVRHYKGQGIECKGVWICNVTLDSVVGDRNWTWGYMGLLSEIRTYQVILRSRSNKAP